MTTTPTPTPASTPSETAKVVPGTWKSTTLGILIIISGVIAIVAEAIYIASGNFGIFAGVPFIESSANPDIYALFATGAIAIVGGIFALRRRMWWLAIVGVVFSMFFTIWPLLVVGGISIILIALSRPEFQRVKK
jgi:hypothetical protein